jgi:hypothetical protein
VSILQDFIFAARQDVYELHFRLEHLDHHGEKIESFLATLLYSLHALGLDTDAPTTSEVILYRAIQMSSKEEVDTCELHIT